MPTPVTAEYFQTHAGVDATTAKEYERQHNELAGYHTAEPAPATSPAAPSPAPRAPLNPAHEAQVAARAAEVQKLTGTDAATARSVAEEEFRYSSSSGADRSVMLAELEAGRTEGAIQQSIDAGMKPATAPYQYLMPSTPETDQERAIDSELRQAMFSAGLPIEVGNSIARQVEETAQALVNASDEEIARYVEDQRVTLQRMLGAGYESRVATMRDFLREAGLRSPPLRALIEQHPELFSHWTVVDKLTQVADYQRRISKGAVR